jgi:hypothetical protein
MKQSKRNTTPFIIVLFLFSGISLHAQSKIPADTVNNVVFTKAEVDAQFPGGIQAWGNYIGNNLDPNLPVKNGAPVGKYKVIIRFIINKDGSISDIQPETSFGYGMEDEAIRVIKMAPKWIPAMQNKQKVNAYKRQPITFVVSADSTKTNNNSADTALSKKVAVEANVTKVKGTWADFLMKELDTNVPVRNGAPIGSYIVIIKFFVETDGSLGDFEPQTNFGYGMEDEVIRVLKKSPKWDPAVQNGKLVKAEKIQPIKFDVD